MFLDAIHMPFLCAVSSVNGRSGSSYCKIHPFSYSGIDLVLK
jgi:hypothetical protein